MLSGNYTIILLFFVDKVLSVEKQRSINHEVHEVHEEHEEPCLWLGKHEACHAESVVVNLLVTKV